MLTYQRGSTKTLVVIIVVAVILLFGGYLYSKQRIFAPAKSDVDGVSDVMQDSGEMMDDQSTMDDHMPSGNDAGMETGADFMMDEGGGATPSGDPMMQQSLELTGAILAGDQSPLVDFNEADYQKAIASDRLVVLYFYANWCPICQEETASSLYPAFQGIDNDSVIGFRVNFNDSDTDQNEIALAKQYGVAYQHTKVFILNGKRVLKSPESWTKQRYADEIAAVIH